MSRIEQLIAELCPDGVEWKELGEVVEILDYLRKPISKDKRESGIYPYYGANGILGYVKDYIFNGTYLLFGEDGSVIHDDGTPVLTWAKGKIWVNNHAHVLSEIQESALLRYVYYCLSTIDVTSIVRGMPPKINQKSLRTILIPIPPLPIQQEIVRILDTFTYLDAELQAELEHYRNQLLNFEGKEVEWNIIGNIGKVLRGKRLTRNQLSNNEGYPVFHGGLEPLGYYINKNRPAQTVMVINVGASAGTVGFCSEDFWSSDGCFSIEHNNSVKSRYLFYVLLCKEKILRSKVRVAGIPTLDALAVENINIPVPPLSEQERIVGILDKFDKLVYEVLPAEIAARRKQYEYYREKLLTFEPLVS